MTNANNSLSKGIELGNSDLSVVCRRRGEELHTSSSHQVCSGDDVVGVQCNVLDPSGSMLLQEGVNLVTT